MKKWKKEALRVKKILMPSAQISDIALIKQAREMGLYVITSGYNPRLPGHAFGNEYAPFDYSDYDGMTALAERLQVDAVSQGCSDNCALTAAYIGEKLGLKGHDTFENAQIIHRKDYFKKFAGEIGLQSPVSKRIFTVGDACEFGERYGYPVIIKPTDLGGGQGISVAYDASELESSVKKAFEASRVKHVIVEQYLTGGTFSFTTFIVRQKVAFWATFNDYSYKNRYMTNSGIVPADNEAMVTAELIRETEKVAKALGLVDGLLHMQYMVRDGHPMIIEMMRRMPGNDSTSASSNYTGVNVREWVLRAECGEDLSGIPQRKQPEKIYGYHTVMSGENGILDHIEISEEFRKYVISFDRWEEDGTVIDNYLNQKFGVMQFAFDTAEEKEKYIGGINEHVRVFLK